MAYGIMMQTYSDELSRRAIDGANAAEVGTPCLADGGGPHRWTTSAAGRGRIRIPRRLLIANTYDYGRGLMEQQEAQLEGWCFRVSDNGSSA
eukprot:1513463-Prorocentrum_lima.AAC.1